MTPADSSTILAILKQLQRRHQLQTCAALLGGAVLSLLGPLFVTLFFLLFSMTLIASYGFWGAYRIIAAVSLPILAYLLYHQIVDLSKRADRVWLSSDFRQRLKAARSVD